jgi:hypothetical protein
MNIRFVIRGLLLALPIIVLGLGIWIFLQTPYSRPPDPTPPPPTILVPRGRLPIGPAGLEEWAQYENEDYVLVGSGYLLSLEGGEIVGVTAAHSVSIGNPDQPLEQIALRVPGQIDFVGEFDTLRGRPGHRLTIHDMTADYALLFVQQPINPSLLLTPDARGAPQPGERVTLYSGVRGHTQEGTVQSSSDKVVWVLMDERFDPSLMSGSPLISQHTGQVVGMAVAASPRLTCLYLGVHPIGSIVEKAEFATEFPKLVELPD